MSRSIQIIISYLLVHIIITSHETFREKMIDFQRDRKEKKEMHEGERERERQKDEQKERELKEKMSETVFNVNFMIFPFIYLS